MTKDEYRRLQLDYLIHATRYYRKKNEAGDMDSRSGQLYYHLLRNKERSMSLQRLRVELRDLTPQDFEKSSVMCECGKHYKLQSGNVLICPISLGIQWTRLYLAANVKVDFDIEELIERAK